MKDLERQKSISRWATRILLSLLLAVLAGTATTSGKTGWSVEEQPVVGTNSPPAFWILAQAKNPKTLDSLYAAAKQEGKVVLWGPTDPEQIAPVAQAFKKRFPGIEVTHFHIQPPEFTQRLVAEAQAGKSPEADIFELGPREIIVLRERGLLQVHKDWVLLFDLPSASIYEGGIGVTNHDLPHIVAVNTSLVKKSEYPKTWDDLLDPKWKGKIIIEQRAQNIGGLGLVKGMDWLKKFALGLKAQQPIYVTGGTTSFNQLVSGQAPLSIGPYLFHILEGKKKGAPADLLPLSPMLVSPRLTSIHMKSKHPHAGKLFAGWLVTPPAQKILEQASSRASVAPDSGTEAAKLLKAHGIELVVDNEETSRKRVEMEKFVQDLLGVRR
jgi:iron(III) transport system substrate-binding protein